MLQLMIMSGRILGLTLTLYDILKVCAGLKGIGMFASEW